MQGTKRDTDAKNRSKSCGFDPWAGKIPWRRAWQPLTSLKICNISYIYEVGEGEGGMI